MSRKWRNTPRDSYEEQLLYDGRLGGSRVNSSNNSQNFDFSNFPLFCEGVFELLELEDPLLRRKMSFCFFLHAMTEYLNAYLIELKRPETFPNYNNLLDVMRASYNYIPTPIFEYINGIGKVKTAAGLDVDFNLPVGGTPQGPLDANGDEAAMESGSFGSCTAETHNSYECYVSPYITRKLIERTLFANTTSEPDRFGDWSPLPPGRYPKNGIANKNLLGYQMPEFLHYDGISSLINVDFCNDNAGLGRICHSSKVLARVSAVLSSFSQKFHMSLGNFNGRSSYFPKKDSAAFIYKNYQENIAPGYRITNFLDTLNSPESFDERAANKAVYFGYKKQRNLGSVGSCYTVDGKVPEGWEETRNNNFNMIGSFAPRPDLKDLVSLRDGDHKSYALGCCNHVISEWLRRHFRKTQ